MSLIRILIVDDEPAARVLLGCMLEEEPGVEVAGTCRDGAEAVRWLGTHQADLVFLDIQMPRLDGFEVIEETAPADLPPVIFVTAFDEFAVRAFKVQAWDYLLKPFDAERLGETLARARRRLEAQAPERITEGLGRLLRRLSAQPAPIERLTVRKGKARVTVRVVDVDWIEAESNYVRLHLAEASYLARTSLSGLEAKLDPRRFVRIHRSVIVNVDRIARLEPCGHGDMVVILQDDRRLNLSRRYRERFERVFEPLS